MSVYVDNAFIQASVPNGGRTVTSKWCHMTADSREELDDMAELIGLRLRWIQHPDEWHEHYDVTVSRRAAAVKAGAIEVDWGERVKQMRENWIAQHGSLRAKREEAS